MQTLEDERSDSIEIDEELSIYFDSITRDFSVNMTFTFPNTFKAKEGQSSVIYGDVEKKETPTTAIIEEKDKPRCSPSPKAESEKFPTQELEKKIEIVEHEEYGY